MIQLILSGAYCSPEVTTEFGLIPPAFLPVGNKRLYELQITGEYSKTYITLPSDFDIRTDDLKRLESLNVKLIQLPRKLSLIQSFQVALEIIGREEPIDVLFGDTYVEHDQFNATTSFFGVKNTTHFYEWASIKKTSSGFEVTDELPNESEATVITGYFRFCSIANLKAALNKCQSFTQLLNYYNQHNTVNLVELDTWLDFGHLLTYHESKKALLVSRAFNSVRVKNGILTKRSEQKNKMSFEHSWFKTLPQELRLYTPKVFNLIEEEQTNAYEMEYLYFSPLCDLFVFGRLPFSVWKEVVDNCFRVLETNQEHQPEEKNAIQQIQDDCSKFLLREKILSRFGQFLSDQRIEGGATPSINGHTLPSYEAIISRVIELIPESRSSDIGILHGDFFFGNLLYNFRSKRIVMLDPRGSVNGQDASNYGDVRYDIAKLAHSIVGGYDQLITKRCQFSAENANFMLSLEMSDAQQRLINYFFSRIEEAGFKKQEIMAITASLFFSMLPLHNDDSERQHILLANGLRIFQEYLQ